MAKEKQFFDDSDLNDIKIQFDLLRNRVIEDKDPVKTTELFVSELKNLDISPEDKYEALQQVINRYKNEKLVSLDEDNILIKLGYHSRFIDQLSKSATELQLELQIEKHIKNIMQWDYVDPEQFIKANDQIQKNKDWDSKTLAQRTEEMEKGGYTVIDKEILNNDRIKKLIEKKGPEEAAKLIASKFINLEYPEISNSIENSLKVIKILNPNKRFIEQLNTSTAELAAKDRMQISNNKKLPNELEEALAVKNYMSIETDAKKREEFASKQLQNYCNKQNISKLNDTETKRISEAIVDILKPLCKNDPEKESLKKNTEPLVRECAKKAGAKMSFGEAWKAYIVDPIKKLFGRENKIQKLLGENTKVTDTLRKSLSITKEKIANTIIPKNPQKSSGHQL